MKLTGKKILIVDDEPDLAKMMGILLRAKGFLVDTATDGGAGLEKVKSFRPDVILLDLLMPQMDGWEFCRKLRADADPQTRDTAVIIMTALLSWHKLNETSLDGIYPILVKPFKEDDLLQAIQSVMEKETP